MPRELRQVVVSKVSLVGVPANGEAIAVLKDAQGISARRGADRVAVVAAPAAAAVAKEAVEMKVARVVYVSATEAVNKAAFEIALQKAGFSIAMKSEVEGVTLYSQGEGQGAADAERVYLLDTGIMVGVSGGTEPPAINVTKASEPMGFYHALGAYGVLPLLCVARDILGSVEREIFWGDPGTPAADIKKAIAAACDDHKEYVLSVLAYMPDRALKLDKEISEMSGIDLYKGMLAEPPKPAATAADAKPAAAAAAAAPAAAAVEKSAEEIAAEAAAATAAVTAAAAPAAAAVEKGNETPAAEAGAAAAAAVEAPAGTATQKSQEPAPAAPAATADHGADPNAAMAKLIADQFAAALGPLQKSIEGISAKVDIVEGRVAKAEGTLQSTTVGGHSGGDRVQKAADADAGGSDNFAFDTANGRMP